MDSKVLGIKGRSGAVPRNVWVYSHSGGALDFCLPPSIVRLVRSN